MNTVAILPMKALENAKQRLAEALGPGFRRALVEAMYADVLVAIRRTSAIDAIIVVTSDDSAARIAVGNDAIVIADTTASQSHSRAAMLGVERALAEGAARVLMIPGDCPLLDPAELERLLARPQSGRSAVIIPDRHGTGTNGLLLTPPDALTPAFGVGSRARHFELAVAQGATPEVIELPTLGLDIDTPDDLDTLRATLAATRGGAAHTRGMLSQLDRSGAL